MVMSPAQFYARVDEEFGSMGQGSFRRSRPHKGTDFSWGEGIEIPAYRGGVVFANLPRCGELGNVLVVRWDPIDNLPGTYYAGFCHLREPPPYQHGHWFGVGDVLGVVGATGRVTGAHLHTTLGPGLNSYAGVGSQDPVPYIRRCLATIGNQPEAPPPPPPLPLEGDDMIRIVNTHRGIALIGAGYYRPICTNEELSVSSSVMSKHIEGNEREWDLWASLALGGVSAKSTV
ncbi:MAG: hypothetical protein B5766_08250 [Candidatus Lumbricidophila eiseniae]|uniref:M23ase beta-sheet core domain-containing protein n=1 Tax=Candidatus Lumbricidiphila eiseniae TaxID=1969409 RepID=A0A2A6FQU1_9MICO|nr:MAG: hypothetical protein B5766_08250 [Candidatus Lumbricidophila eiseniae]